MEFTFAEVAAIDRVAGVVGVLHLLGVDLLMGNADGRRLNPGIFEVFGEKGGGDGGDGQGAIAEYIIGDFGHKRRINAAGIGN